MTNQNNAAQPLLTDDEIRAIQGQHLNTIGSIDKQIASVIVAGRAIETALLSKLRAPVADHGFKIWKNQNNAWWNCRARFGVGGQGLTPDDAVRDWADRNATWRPASAPVADERAAFESDYAKAWNAAYGNKTNHTASDVAKLREGDGYGHDLDYLKGRWDGWQARAALASAPVADERAAFESDYAKAWNAAYGNKTNHTASDVAKLREGDGYGHDLDYLKGRWDGWQARAALASAPVAKKRSLDGDQLRAIWVESGEPGNFTGDFIPMARRIEAALSASPASAPVAGAARPAGWRNALRIAELPEVDEALANFCDDSTKENAVSLVLAVLCAAPQASEADVMHRAIKTCGTKVIKALAAIARANGPDTRREDDPELIYRSPVMDEVVRIRQAYDELSAALSAQPGAQRTGGSDA